jgi:outer membrane protein OmpA-like peptidoglycan-associated protein
MNRVDDLSSQFIDLNHDEAVQLENFLNLLLELQIIEIPEQVSSISTIETHINQDLTSAEIELIQVKRFELQASEAYLESHDVIYLEATLESPQISTSLPHPTREVVNEELSKIVVPIDQNLEESIAAFKKLQQILVGYELSELQDFTTNIHEKLTKLEHQIYDSNELINLILPWMTELLRRKINESKEEIVEAITPIVDKAIQSRVEQDRESMGLALASAIPSAITQQICVNSEEVAAAIAPTMGQAIKKQIEIEKDAIVDAFYPIIGNTVAKYMGETVRAINEKIEETLSYEGIKRKIRAKLQGVSEAELIFKEALPFTIQAIFLIQKSSGLIISDVQPDNAQRLESEMIAGMLTAIRSFANDCIIQSGTNSELDAINYGTSKIVLEVAGYCYLAIIVQGEPPKAFISKMRQILGKIIRSYGKSIEEFDGDPDTIPNEMHTLLEALKDYESHKNNTKNQSSPLLLLILTVFTVVFIPWGFWQYRSSVIRSVENKTTLMLASAPELAVYRLTVQENHGKLELTGRLPNQLLRWKAEQIAKESAPEWLIDNQIISVEVPPDPVLTNAEVKRVTEVLNQMDGAAISSQYIAGKVVVEGIVNRSADAKAIAFAFEQIPGVKLVSSVVLVQPLQVDVRFYFQPNSATLMPADLSYKIKQVKLFLTQHPSKHLRIIGYSYSSDPSQQIALARAKAVQQALIKEGVNPSRLQVISKTNLPPGIDRTQPIWLNRCVVLEAIAQQTQSN